MLRAAVTPPESIYSKALDFPLPAFYRRKETVREKEEALLKNVLLNSESRVGTALTNRGHSHSELSVRKAKPDFEMFTDKLPRHGNLPGNFDLKSIVG